MSARTSGLGATGGDAFRTSDDRAKGLGPGTVLAERYEIRALLGAGGMGAVYRAQDRLRKTDIALKVMLPSLLAQDKAVERFEHEAEVMLRLSHPGIVRVFDVGLDRASGLRFYTMELLWGLTLRAWLNERRERKEEVPALDALEIVGQLLEALGHAHRLTVHRDLKPENVFVLATDPFEVRILDFGIARIQTATRLTSTSMSLGTAYYMSPEQELDAATVDGRADLFSLAVILYEMLTGKVPVGRFKTPTEARASLPRGIDELTLCALAPDPEDRPRSAAVFLEQVREVQGTLVRMAGVERGAGDGGARPPVEGEAKARPEGARAPPETAPAPHAEEARDRGSSERRRVYSLAPIAALLIAAVLAVVWIRTERNAATSADRRARMAEEEVREAETQIANLVRMVEDERGARAEVERRLAEASKAELVNLDEVRRAGAEMEHRLQEVQAREDFYLAEAARKVKEGERAHLVAAAKAMADDEAARAKRVAEEKARGMRKSAASGLFVWDTGKGLEIEMVYVPPGDFLLDDEKKSTPMPQGYFIGRCETTWGQYLKFCDATGREKPDRPSWVTSGDHPVVNVTALDADAYCAWAGLALPTDEQWQKAARGTDGRKYPWGDAWVAAKCNHGRVSEGDECDESDGYEYSAPVGSFPRGASPCGALDMAGNVAEWLVTQGPYKSTRLNNGGDWHTGPERCRSKNIFYAATSGPYVTIGFRPVRIDKE